MVRGALNSCDPQAVRPEEVDSLILQELLKQEMEVDRRHDEQLLALQQARQLEPRSKQRDVCIDNTGNHHPESVSTPMPEACMHAWMDGRTYVRMFFFVIICRSVGM